MAAVDDVTVTVEAGSLTTVVGPSGSGKTTLLRLLAGFDVPDAGEISIGDRVVAGPDVWVAPERRRVGMVSQRLALFPHLSVGQNIGFGLRGVTREVRAARVAELLQLVALAGFEERRVSELSGGQAQRVALARALAPSPDVVALDEPFSDLDPGRRRDLGDEVVQILRARGTAAVLVTHDRDEALALGDQVVVLLDGAVAQAAPPGDVVARPAAPAVAAFLGAGRRGVANAPAP